MVETICVRLLNRTAGLMSIRYVLLWLITFFALYLPNPSEAYSFSPKNVLILHSYHIGYKWTDELNDGIQSGLVVDPKKMNLHVEYMDTKRIADPRYPEKLAEVYKFKYSDIKFDVIIASDDNAFNFLRKYRDAIFPGASVVFCGVNNFKDSDLQGLELFSGVNEQADIRSTIDIALKLHPDTRQIVVVNDTTTTGLKMKEEMARIIPEFTPHVKFVFLEDIDPFDLLKKLEGVSHDSLVLYMSYFRDKSGRYLEYNTNVTMVAENCDVPVYGLMDFVLGYGVVGGMLTSGYYQGKAAAEIASLILNGERPDHIPVVKKSPNRYMFDYNQLTKFNIDISSLPADSIIINKPYSLYSEYQFLFLGAAVFLIIVTGVIFILSMNNIKRRHAETELRKSRDLLAAVIRAVPVALFSKDRNGRYLILNDAFLEFLGAPASKIVGKTVHQCWPPEDAAVYSEKDTQLLDDGTVQIFEYRLLHAEKGYRDGIFKKACFHDADGATAGLIGTFLDITDRKLAEEALRESEKRYRAVVEDMPMMICRFQADGTVTFANSAYCQYYAKTENELIGLNFFQAIVEEDQEAIKRKCYYLDQDKPMITCEFRVMLPDGTVRWQEWIGRALFDGNGGLTEYQAIGRDITEIRLAREEKTRIEKHIQKVQKMEAIGTLAAGIAHDFNNILGAIMGFVEIALMDLPGKHPMRNNLEQVLRASDRAKNLVRQILAFSRQSREEKRPFDVLPVFKETLKMLRASLPTTIDIRQDILTSSGTIIGDPTEFHQVLMNICTNAFHAMQEQGGVLTVRLEDVDVDTDTVAFHPDLSPGLYLKLSITDTGQGMEPAVMDRIFEPYFTTREATGGSGLGLAVVHGIIKQYGGAVKVFSTPGKGTTFEVFFPKIDVDSVDIAESKTPIPTGTEKILFVDDELSLVDTARQILGHLGYEVESTTSSTQALELFSRQPESFDLVITDQTMPNLTGAEMAVKLMAIRPDIPIILCTGFSSVIVEEQARAMGIRAFIMKPVVLRELAIVIRQVLDEPQPDPVVRS